jgi:hypothetical protein
MGPGKDSSMRLPKVHPTEYQLRLTLLNFTDFYPTKKKEIFLKF